MATAISPASSASAFFPLPNRQPAANSVSRARNSDAAFPQFTFDSIANIGTTPAILDVTDFVDLSPEAQHLLDFFTGAAGGLTGNPILDDNGIVLTEVQQAQIDAIILKFRDAPFTAETFRDITEELAAAGLSPEQVIARQTASPLTLSQIFLRALSGEANSANDFLSFNTQSDRDSRDAYTRQIFAEWQRVSTQFRPPLIANFIEPPTILRRQDEI